MSEKPAPPALTRVSRKMKLRIRSKWRSEGKQVTLEDNAGALAYVIWQLALGSTRNLHVERFEYENDEERAKVIGEYLTFLVHVADRMASDNMDDDERARFVTTLAQQTARQYQSNRELVSGRADYRGPYVELLNQRGAEYAATTFTDGEPGYQMMRNLGYNIQQVMGESQTNRWVIDQVMEIDAPGAVDQLRQSMNNLFATGDVTASEHPLDNI